VIPSDYFHGNRYYLTCLCLSYSCCPVDVPAVAGVISVLSYRVSERGACIQLYRILFSYGRLTLRVYA